MLGSELIPHSLEEDIKNFLHCPARYSCILCVSEYEVEVSVIYLVLSELSVFKLPLSLLLSGQIPVGVLCPEGVRRGILGEVVAGELLGDGEMGEIFEILWKGCG